MPKRKPREDELLQTPSEPIMVKAEEEVPDSPEVAKKKLSTASRTSTACDRCRVRKMRCDDQADGCTPCRQNQTECKTTDRLTGKATVRGYVESLEHRIQELERQNERLRSRVDTLGGTTIAEESWDGSYKLPLLHWQGVQHDSQASSSQSCSGESVTQASVRRDLPVDPSLVPTDYERRRSSPGEDSHVSSADNTILSTMGGPSISILGMQIDLAGARSADVDEPFAETAETPNPYNKSYFSFMRSAFGTVVEHPKLDLPVRSEAFRLSEIYFRGINPYVPVLHKPTFMRTLTRIYDERGFVPSTAELVMCHTILAIVHFQLVKRGRLDDTQKSESNAASNSHYHFALSFFTKLMSSRKLVDLQALMLLGMHVRNLPKPEAACLMSTMLLNLAVETGLHRSVQSWPPTMKRPSVLQGEMRKRVFWGILLLHVTTAGALGRPMGLRNEDFDVEQPEVIDDELLTEEGIDTSKVGHCNFLIGLQAMRAVPIFMDLYKSIYAVKRSRHTYLETVADIETRLQNWVVQWPRELTRQSATDDDIGNSHARYLEIAPLHVRLLLRHPSLSLTSDALFNAESVRICLDVSEKILHHALRLQKLNSLDATWQTTALYVLAISTTLSSHWETRDRMTAVSLAKLGEDMGHWLGIICDLGRMLELDKKLQTTVNIMMESTLTRLARHIGLQKPEAKLASNGASVPTLQASSGYGLSPRHYDRNGRNGFYAPSQRFHEDGFTGSRSVSTTLPTPYMSPAATHSNLNPVDFPEPSHDTYQQAYSHHQHQVGADYNASTCPPAEGLATTVNGSDAYMRGYQSAPPMHNSYLPEPIYPHVSAYGNHRDSSSWKNFHGGLGPGMDPAPEYMSSASALMQLGRAEAPPSNHDYHLAMGMLSEPTSHGGNPQGVAAQDWPYMLYDDDTHGR